MSQFYCQNSLVVLKNLNIIEKAIIAKVHLVVTILKLKPSNKFNLGFCRGTWDHIVILFQNPGPLLTLFASNLSATENIVYIIWLKLN